MGLVSRRDLQNPGLHLGETLLLEPGPHCLGDGGPRHQNGPPIGMTRR